MAADTTSMGVNGTYTNGQYDVAEQNYESHSANQSVSATNEYNVTTGTGSSGSSHTDISKDEVGWYFVEQYYTTLSKSPEKLFLFYNKQSQFVSGTEAEKVSVCVGQKAINDRIKELEIQDCKVRVTNVDSQGSRANIVIQVIGEISNRSQPQRKFTQTFVLAEQTNGYFVLNDIFRYILEDDEYDPAEGEQPHAQPLQDATTGHQEAHSSVRDTATPQDLTSAEEPVAQVDDAAIVDGDLEEVTQKEEHPVIAGHVNGITSGTGPEVSSVVEAEDTPADALTATTETSEATADVPASIEAEEVEQLEKPQVPEPTQAPSPAKQAPAQPAPAPKPSAPKTWAQLAGSRTATAVAAPPTTAAAAIAPAPSKPSPAATTSHEAAATPVAQIAPSSATPLDVESPATAGSSGSEWQTAGHEHSRKQSRIQNTQQPVENSRGYIKNVQENVEQQALQDALAKVAQVTYVDVSRAKNCAFVDFATPADYRAAVAANPYEIDGQRLFVEERRVRPYPQGSFPPRGGMRGRGGTPGGPPRGGMKDGTRGGSFGGRGGGGRGGFRGGARGGAPTQAV